MVNEGLTSEHFHGRYADNILKGTKLPICRWSSRSVRLDLTQPRDRAVGQSSETVRRFVLVPKTPSGISWSYTPVRALNSGINWEEDNESYCTFGPGRRGGWFGCRSDAACSGEAARLYGCHQRSQRR